MLTPDQARLAADYVPFARAVARGKTGPQWRHHADEIEAACVYQLARCAARWDGSRGVRFATFAGRRMALRVSELKRQIAARHAHERAASRPDAAADGGFRRVDDDDEVRALCRRLRPGPRRVVLWLWEHGGTQQDAARALGISETHVSRLVALARQKAGA